MKYQIMITAFLFWTASLAGTAMADNNIQFVDLPPSDRSAGQIKGSVTSCSGGFNLHGTLVHIPGISVSTKLGSKSDFKLLSVPEGNYELVFEYEGRVLNSIPQVTVRDKMMTTLKSITLCPDKDGDGYNLMTDLDDSNPAIHPGAKEICDRVDNNGNGEVDERCSYRKCPKGGKFCLNNWNNSNRIMHHAEKSFLPSARLEESSNKVEDNRSK
jgi:putative metal-binding protein